MEVSIRRLSARFAQYFALGAGHRAPHLLRGPRITAYILLAMSVRAEIEAFARVTPDILERVCAADNGLCFERFNLVLDCRLNRENALYTFSEVWLSWARDSAATFEECMKSSLGSWGPPPSGGLPPTVDGSLAACELMGAG
jgi:hypothetical protein